MILLLLHVAVAAGVLLVVGAALHDIAVRTVPNCLSLGVVAVGLLCRALDGNWLMGAGAAGLVFGAAILLWLRGMMGGGDAKLLGAVALVAPPDHILQLLLMIALCGGALALFYLGMSFIVTRPAAGPRRTFAGRIAKAERWRLSRRGPLPYAAAIAGGTILSLSPLVAG